jgi:hypothetical protein
VGAQGGTSAGRSGAALSFVSCIRLLGGAPLDDPDPLSAADTQHRFAILVQREPSETTSDLPEADPVNPVNHDL